ncbi:hypothetical protein Dacet_0659 [Denitrovibrio acetiphilus DSM 12809]|uniref:Relaxase/mobilization nuclease family protein n=1 Tax=Denitrovibrio acetiphilus (strain DSM 12809 / NBRC 114555 / N2460) TaxID=522772 RepID=D4H4Q3_DENA2|nr:hypothetical protein [Denitrovibrio acetiphilus]ADD67447.1 hypothetical protein Dacet_0659 [Denitrovibrio acetiphilus DSM 12809]
MIIVPGSGKEGIEQYLLTGKMYGRDKTRDELDRRVQILGNFDVTKKILDNIKDKGWAENYYHFTISFSPEDADKLCLGSGEPEAEKNMVNITEQVVKMMGAGFKKDDYNVYAEAHLPRLKSYKDKLTGEEIERLPHIHVVMPKVHLSTGNQLVRCEGRTGGKDYKEMLAANDATQELINKRFGLTSPKTHRRLYNNRSELLGRYKEMASEELQLIEIRVNIKKAANEAIIDLVKKKEISTHKGIIDYLWSTGEFTDVEVIERGNKTEIRAYFLEGEPPIVFDGYLHQPEFFKDKSRMLLIDKHRKELSSRSLQDSQKEKLKSEAEYKEIMTKYYINRRKQVKKRYAKAMEKKRLGSEYLNTPDSEFLWKELSDEQHAGYNEDKRVNAEQGGASNHQISEDAIKGLQRIRSSGETVRKNVEEIYIASQSYGSNMNSLESRIAKLLINKMEKVDPKIIKIMTNRSRVFWAIYEQNIPPAIMIDFHIRSNRMTGVVEFMNYNTGSKITDNGNLICLSSSGDMRADIKKMIMIGVSKGWLLGSMMPTKSSSETFKELFFEVHAQVVKERKLHETRSIMSNDKLLQLIEKVNISGHNNLSEIQKGLERIYENAKAEANKKELADIKAKLDPQICIDYAKEHFEINESEYAAGGRYIMYRSRKYNVVDFFTKHLNMSIKDAISLLNKLYTNGFDAHCDQEYHARGSIDISSRFI